MFFDRQVRITLNGQDTFFPCNKCKSCTECMNGMKCKIQDYMSVRLPDVRFKLNNHQPQIIVDVADITQAKHIINRAIRMRNMNRVK